MFPLSCDRFAPANRKADWPPAATRPSGRMSEEIASADALAEKKLRLA
ncbi:hypothetical protein ACFCW2_06225 [Qipengyuania sp. DSG2-2]